MEWRKYYLDAILVPLGLVMMVAYHVWLWHKTQTQPFTTTFGREADGRRLWVLLMIKVFFIFHIFSQSLIFITF